MESSTSGNSIRVAVVQDGARLHYAVPLALYRAEALGVMFSEGYLKPGLISRCLIAMGRSGILPGGGAFERRCDEIPGKLVRTNIMLALRQRRAKPNYPSLEMFYRWSARQTGQWILSTGIGNSNAIYGFIRNLDPEMCRVLHDRGILTAGDQIIAPAAIEAHEAKLQAQRWPEWDRAAHRPDYGIIEEVERATWAALDHITCASEYVRQGLTQQGIAVEKIDVLPYPIDAGKYAAASRSSGGGVVTVGFVGSVNLRKGAPYFLEVARRLGSNNLKFVMVGPTDLPAGVIQTLSHHVELTGRVVRPEVSKWLGRFDMMLFPSTCEGSAGAVMEGMASGLPVVTSPNSGSLVRDGVDGFVRPYDDIDGLCQCVQRLADDAELRRNAGIEARKFAESITLESYGKRLVQALGRISQIPAIG